MMAWLGALGAALAVWWWLPSPASGLARLSGSPPQVRRGGRRRPGGVVGVGVAAAGGLVALAVLAGPGAAAMGLAVAQIACTVALLGRRRSRRRALVAGRAAVVHAGELVAGLLRVGRVPSAALVEASVDAPVLAVAAAELRAGGEASAALRRASGLPGHEGLDDLAAAWEVAVRTGASLVGAVDASAARLAAEADVARVVDAELSAARLGGRAMALLPFVGVFLGMGLGGDPAGFLTGSPLGWLCLNVGIALTCAGTVWIDTVAERSGGR